MRGLEFEFYEFFNIFVFGFFCFCVFSEFLWDFIVFFIFGNGRRLRMVESRVFFSDILIVKFFSFFFNFGFGKIVFILCVRICV